MPKAESAERKRYDVAIAGGGIAGRALALALAEFAPEGFRIALVDDDSGQGGDDDARGLALSAATRNLLSVLGLWRELEPKAQSIESIEITDSALDAALRPHFLGFDEEVKGDVARAYMIEYGALSRTLAAAAARRPCIAALAPDAVIGFDADAFRAQTHLRSGMSVEAALVVAADGKRSRVRDLAGIKCVGWSYPQTGIATTVAHAKPHHGRAVQHFLPSGPFAILPLKGDRSSIVWTEEKAQAEAITSMTESDFLDELTKRFGHRLGEVRLAGPVQSFPLDMQIARSLIANRLALIGDAAHVVHPLAGQGLNIGMRDVAALAETIVEGLRLGLDIGGATQLARYERWRRFDSAFSAAVMDGLNRLFSNDSAPLRILRDLGLGLVDRAPPLKRFLARDAAGRTGTVPHLLSGQRL